MIPAEKSSFSFVEFKVQKSHFTFLDFIGTELGISFNASGKHFVKTNIFKLFLTVNLQTAQDKKDFIEIETESTFAIKAELTEMEGLMKYFVTNAPALVFPYIRSYISTLTTQSGNKPILLPTMNLIGLAEQLRKNIETVTD